jgi:DNA (cytosine-5)-methyltransferase 1
MELFSSYPPLNMKFTEPLITFEKATKEFWKDERKPLTPTAAQYYDNVEEGKSFSSVHEKGSLFNWMKLARHKPAPTLACENRDCYYHPTIPGVINEREYMVCGSYPLDYDSLGTDPKWLVGMSVPPIMMAQIALRIKENWLDKIYAYKKLNIDK